MVQTTILQAISSGNVTVEQIKSTTHLSPKAIEVGIQELIENGIIAIDGNGNYYNSYSYGGDEVTPKNTSQQNKQGDNMNKELKTNNKGKKQLKCTPEQLAFRRSVCQNKGKIYDAQSEGKVFTHRGNQVLFAGAGDGAFRYKIAVSGLSDKNPIEFPVLYLDWDDSALYDEGGLADQVKEIIGNGQPAIQPTIVATVVGSK